MIVGGMASIPERASSLRRAVASILPHVSTLHVALNGYAEVPEFLNVPKVSAQLTTNERGDANKFLAFDGKCTFMSFDDDLTYTPEYFTTMLRAMLKHRGIVSLHGRRLIHPFRSYFKSTEAFRCLGRVEEDVRVDFGGTGVMAIPKGALRMTMADLPVANMADVWVGVLARAQRVPIWVPAHSGREVRHNPIDLRRTIYGMWRPGIIDSVVRGSFLA